MNNSQSTITIFFEWNEVTPDPRPYKPGMPRLLPINTRVAVDVPLKHEYLWNAEKIIQWQLGTNGSAKPEPILTPLGMKYVTNLLENAMKETEISQDLDDWFNDDDDDYDDTEKFSEILE